ncbi:MAG: sulfite exporter TauE/SafE family protein, partial [Candidatus Omnitrophica bacterium]|nr:sulfite exporter TauE/SafE family protein [Candidatus Omnitrophota bacterium]
MEYFVIALAAAACSFLTFFSGFGLGTFLLPVFAIFFPLPLAISATAIVHLLNNLFKGALVGRYADRGSILRFGLPA